MLNDLIPRGYVDVVLLRGLETLFDLVKLVVIYIILRAIIKKGVRRLTVPLMNKESEPLAAKRLLTLTDILTSAMLYGLAILFGILLLRTIGIDPVPLVTAAGVAGLAVGFGAQKLVRDVISGFFILLENQFAVGEFVTIGTVTGVVQEMSLRSTRVTDQQGKLYILSNGDINTVCNHSRSDVLAAVEISIAVGADINAATEILNKVGSAVSGDFGLQKPYQVEGISGFDGAKTTLRLSGWAPALLQEQVLMELRQQALAALKSAGIGVV